MLFLLLNTFGLDFFVKRTKCEELILSELLSSVTDESRMRLERQFRAMARIHRNSLELFVRFKRVGEDSSIETPGDSWALMKCKLHHPSLNAPVSVSASLFQGYLTFITFTPEIPVWLQNKEGWEVSDVKIKDPAKAKGSKALKSDSWLVTQLCGLTPNSVTSPLDEATLENQLESFGDMLPKPHLELLKACGGAEFENLRLRGADELQPMARIQGVVVGDVHEGLFVWNGRNYGTYDFDGTLENEFSADLAEAIRSLSEAS